jgi:hypothetical protein
VLFGASLVLAAAAHAQVDWRAAPTVAGPLADTFEYNTPANWNQSRVPVFPDTATFGSTTVPHGSNISTDAFFIPNVGGWTFSLGTNYTFTSTNNTRESFFGVQIVCGCDTVATNSTLARLTSSRWSPGG